MKKKLFLLRMSTPTFHEVLWKVIKDGNISSTLPFNPQTCKEFEKAYEDITDVYYAQVRATDVCERLLPKFSKFFTKA
jgi:hypothetical protein